MSSTHLSIVSPEYKGEKMVAELVRRIVESVTTITDDYEIILVNDASPDNTWEGIIMQCRLNSKVKGINLSRNFGQHYAITAGLSYAKGDWVIVMDCDLQDRPEEIPNLYRKAQDGYDMVLAQRIVRNDSFIKKCSSKIFYKIFSYLTDTEQDASVANFGIYHRKAINAVLSMGDRLRYFPAQIQWVGYHKSYLPIQHDERLEGESSYSIRRLINLALDTIVSFSDKPMRLMMKVGFWMTLLSLAIGLVYFVRYLCGDIEVMGYTSLIISVWFLGSVLISLLGVVGLYLGKAFEQAKNRPAFIIDEIINFEDED